MNINDYTPASDAEKQLYELALDVQNACNLSGVVHAFSRAVSGLWKVVNDDPSKGRGTEWVNRHPVCLLFTDKLADLSGSSNTADCTAAYDLANRIVNGD